MVEGDGYVAPTGGHIEDSYRTTKLSGQPAKWRPQHAGTARHSIDPGEVGQSTPVFRRIEGWVVHEFGLTIPASDRHVACRWV